MTATGPTKIYGGPAVLDKIVVNTAATGAIAVFDLSEATGATGSMINITPASVPVELEYNIAMLKGIIVNNAGATQDITITFRPA